MADIEGIARRIYNIIISPDTVTGLINGGLSVPLDYGYMVYGIMGIWFTVFLTQTADLNEKQNVFAS